MTMNCSRFCCLQPFPAAMLSLWPNNCWRNSKICGRIVNAPAERLLHFGLNESAATTLLVTGALALRAQKENIVGGTVLNNWQRMVDYCRMAMAHEAVEQFRLLFLDRKNCLLSEEMQQRGMIDHTPVYPREIVKRALEIGAGALILAHNHPASALEHADDLRIRNTRDLAHTAISSSSASGKHTTSSSTGSR